MVILATSNAAGHDGAPVVHDRPGGSGPSVPKPADPATLEHALQSNGHRVTDARRRVHAVLADARDHLSPEQVVQRARGQVNLATVYRVLALLEELGLARATRLGEARTSWELAHPDDHVHLVCNHCGVVDHHVGDAVERLRGHLRSGHGFAATDVELVVSGTCAGCRRDLERRSGGSEGDGVAATTRVGTARTATPREVETPRDRDRAIGQPA